jgi:hypothetical protein
VEAEDLFADLGEGSPISFDAQIVKHSAGARLANAELL